MIFLTLFLEFFKIGLFCFGGGYGMLPLIEETVLAHGWLTEAQFFDFIGVCESTPGPIAINTATYIGSVQGGTPGSIGAIFGSFCATLGVVLPSFIIILLIAAVLKNLTKTRIFKGFIKGVTPVVTGLIIATGVIQAAKALGFVSLEKWNFDVRPIIVFALLVIIYFISLKCFKKKLPAIALILISAALGIGISFLIPV